MVMFLVMVDAVSHHHNPRGYNWSIGALMVNTSTPPTGRHCYDGDVDVDDDDVDFFGDGADDEDGLMVDHQNH